MEGFEVQKVGTLVDALTAQGGYSTRTKARKAIKNGAVKIDGETVKIPSTEVQPGQLVNHDRNRNARKKPSVPKSIISGAKPPFEIVYEDANFLAYVKPSGWITASPKPQLSTTYSRMKAWLEAQSKENNDLHFVNKIEKDLSGICLIAKNKKWREHLQENWNDFRQGIYLLVEGHLPPDDFLACREEDGERVDVAYRTMRATAQHTLLKVDAPIEAVHLIMPSLRREECLIIGKGRNIPDPIDREGIHMFALEVEGLKGEVIMVKTRVPREFLNLMKGGDSPKPNRRRNANVNFNRKPRGRKSPERQSSDRSSGRNTSDRKSSDRNSSDRRRSSGNQNRKTNKR